MHGCGPGFQPSSVPVMNVTTLRATVECLLVGARRAGLVSLTLIGPVLDAPHLAERMAMAHA